MMRLPPLRALQAFRHAGSSLSFKHAADQLYVSPTAISQQIKLLEQALGVPLFRRKTREVILTEEGAKLLPYVTRAFQTLEEGVAQFGEDPDPTRLMLSSFPSFSARFLIPKLGDYRTYSDGVNVHLQTTLSLSSFEGQQLDAAVRLGRGDYPGLQARHLIDDYIIPVCSPSLLDEDRDFAQQLEALPILVDGSEDMQPLWQSFEEASGIACGYKTSRLIVSDASMLIEAVLGGQGVALMRYSLVYELLNKQLLCCPAQFYLESAYALYLVAPEWHFKRDKIERFEAWLRAELRVVEESWKSFSANFTLVPLA